MTISDVHQTVVFKNELGRLLSELDYIRKDATGFKGGRLRSHPIDRLKNDGVQRAYTIRVASKRGANLSTFAELSISNPVPQVLSNIYTASNANSITINWAPSDVPDLKDYAVWLSATADFDPTTTAPSWTGTALTTTIGGLQATTPYYIRVAARDVWKETTWNYSNQITQSTSES